LIILLALVIPLLNPIGLPIATTAITRKYFDAVEAIEPGTHVMVGWDASTATEMEIGLSSRAVLKHLFKQDAKLVIVGTTADGPMLWHQTIDDIGVRDQYDAGYGTQYVYLGFLAGAETAVAAVAANIEEATNGVDFYGNTFDELPLMSEVNQAEDFEIVIAANEVASTATYWMNQWAVPYDLPLYVNPLAGVATGYWQNIEAGQIDAMLVGAKGAAEYELISRSPGPAIASMDAQTLGHLSLIILVILANIQYILTRRNE
jgi:hypothetical protein